MTRLRATKIDEYQFLTCLKHGLWGSKSARFKEWQLGDQLVLLVENAIAGLAEVSGKPFHSAATVWDNGAFPHRIPITFTHASLPENRLRLLGEVRDTLALGFPGSGGGGWGLGVLNQWLLDPAAADRLLAFVHGSPNDLPQMREELDTLLIAAQQKRDAKRVKNGKASPKPAKQPAPPAPEPITQATPDEPSDTPDSEPEEPGSDAESLHLSTQALLVELGRTVGCSVWVASNDRNKLVAGKPLGADCLTSLPSMGLSAEANKAIGLIDVIWLKKNAPVAAFEVEATTSVHSGLLRMSDLVELVPALKMELYVVAPRARQVKVLRELARPTFRRIGLSDICRFVAIDDLAALLKKLEGLKGFVQPEIIDTIALALPEQSQSALA